MSSSLVEGTSHVHSTLIIGVHLRLSLCLASQLIVIISTERSGIVLLQSGILTLVDSLLYEVVVLRRVEASRALLSSLLSGRDLVRLGNTCSLANALYILGYDVILAHHGLLLGLILTIQGSTFASKIVVGMLLSALRVIGALNVVDIPIESIMMRSWAQVHVSLVGSHLDTASIAQLRCILVINNRALIETFIVLYNHGLTRGRHNFLLVQFCRSAS